MRSFLLASLLLLALPVEASKFTVLGLSKKKDVWVYVLHSYPIRLIKKNHSPNFVAGDKDYWIDCPHNRNPFFVDGATTKIDDPFGFTWHYEEITVDEVKYTWKKRDFKDLKVLASGAQLESWANHWKTGDRDTGHWLIAIWDDADGTTKISMDPAKFPESVKAVIKQKKWKEFMK